MGPAAAEALLGEVLAVGNAMNEGTRKGDARAITMDSLLTLTKTKSHCKSRTVLDYIAETLLSNDVDQEASGDGCASSGKSKTGRETLNFVSELPDLEAASRLPIGELCTQVTQLASALQAAKHLLLRAGDGIRGMDHAPPVSPLWQARGAVCGGEVGARKAWCRSA